MGFSAFVVDLLVAGGTLIAKGVFGEVGKGAGKDAYERLKARLQRENDVKTLDLVDRVEETPALKGTIEQDIAASTAGSDPETLQLVEELRAAIATLPQKIQAAYAINGGEFTAGKDIIARQVEGLKGVTMKAGGSIELSGAKSPGK